MKTKFCVLALVLGMTPVFALSAPLGAPQNGTWRSPAYNAGNLQNDLHQRFPNSNVAVSYQNNNTVVLTGNAASVQDLRNIDSYVRSQLGNTQVVDQVTVNGYPYGNATAYPNGTYNRDRDDANRQGDRDRDDAVRQGDRDRDNGYNQGDRDRDRTDADRDHAQRDADANSDHDRNKDRDHDKKHHKNKDKDKDKNKDKDRDHQDQDRDQR